MKKHFWIILSLILLGVSGAFCADVSGKEYIGVYLVGGADWRPFLNDSGLNYCVDYYNRHQGTLSQEMPYVSSLLGFTVGAGMLYMFADSATTIRLEMTYTGLYSPTVQAVFSDSSYTELRTDRGILGINFDYSYLFSYVSVGAGLGLDFDFSGEYLKTSSGGDDKFTTPMIGGKLFLLFQILPFEKSTVLIFIKPYYSVYLDNKYDDLFKAMNHVDLSDVNGPGGDTGRFGIEAGVVILIPMEKDG